MHGHQLPFIKVTLPVNITDLLRFVAAPTSNIDKVKFANMQSTTAEAFLPPVLELLVVVLVRIVNLLLRHSRLMRVVTIGYPQSFLRCRRRAKVVFICGDGG